MEPLTREELIEEIAAVLAKAESHVYSRLELCPYADVMRGHAAAVVDYLRDKQLTS